MVEQVFQRRRNSVIVFAADDDERIGLAVERCQSLENRRRAAALIFLVHAVEQREAMFGGIDYRSRVTAPAEGCRQMRTTLMPARASRTDP